MQLYYPLKDIKAETEIKKSKFISLLFGCSQESEVREILKQIRSEHKNAAHVVYAFITGEGNCLVKGMSDDGEPSGTAGKPVLSILEGKKYTNILIVVVRYFGGIKLGTGGLVKAYSRSALLALSGTEFAALIKENHFKISFAYEHQGGVMSLLKSYGAKIEKEEYSHKVKLEISAKESDSQNIKKGLNDLTSGGILIEDDL